MQILKEGLYRIVWRCSHWTETWILNHIFIKNLDENNNILWLGTSELRFGGVQKLVLELETRPRTEQFKSRTETDIKTDSHWVPCSFISLGVCFGLCFCLIVGQCKCTIKLWPRHKRTQSVVNPYEAGNIFSGFPHRGFHHHPRAPFMPPSHSESHPPEDQTEERESADQGGDHHHHHRHHNHHRHHHGHHHHKHHHHPPGAEGRIFTKAIFERESEWPGTGI